MPPDGKETLPEPKLLCYYVFLSLILKISMVFKNKHVLTNYMSITDGVLGLKKIKLLYFRFKSVRAPSD